MSYDEIMKALDNGLTVHWSNTGYIVKREAVSLYCMFTRNGYYTALHEDEYQDCFIKGVM